MPAMEPPDDSLLDAWRINDRVTTLLVGSLPPEVWGSGLPGSPRRTVRSLAAHLHNTRRMWMTSLGVGAGVPLPKPVDPAKVTPPALVTALRESGERVLRLLEEGLANGGRFPDVAGAFVWGAMPRDVVLFVGYALSHEAHHRGQLVMAARALGHPLSPEVTAGLWQWSSRLRETRAPRGPRDPGPHLV